jgi:hypothetical protein
MGKISYSSGGTAGSENPEVIPFAARLEGAKSKVDEFAAMDPDRKFGLRAVLTGEEPLDGAADLDKREGKLTISFITAIGQVAGRLVIKPSGKTFVNPDVEDPENPKDSPPTPLGEEFIEAVKPLGFRPFRKRQTTEA